MEQWKKNLYTLWFAQVGAMMTITFITSFIPLYVQTLGITDEHQASVWAGILLSTTSLFSATAGPFWGTLADRLGRKMMVERVVFANSIVSFLMPFSTNIYQFLMFRVIQGVFTGITAATLALVTSFTPQDRIGYALGFNQTSIVLGSSLGPLIGGFLANFFGYKTTFWAMSALSLSSWFLVHFIVKENFVRDDTKQPVKISSSFAYVFTQAGVLTLVFINFMVQFSNLNVAPILPLFIRQLGVQEQILESVSGTIIATFGFFSALSAILVGSWSDKIGYKKILMFMALGACMSFFLSFFVQTPVQLILVRALTGVFLGGMLPTTNALINSIISPKKRGSVFGVTQSFTLMGNVLGPITGGFISTIIGYRGIFIITGIMMAFAAFWIKTVVKTPAEYGS